MASHAELYWAARDRVQAKIFLKMNSFRTASVKRLLLSIVIALLFRGVLLQRRLSSVERREKSGSIVEHYGRRKHCHLPVCKLHEE